MGILKKAILPVLLAGIWINISETLRWILLVEPYWIKHYQNMDIVFPTGPINNTVWMVWGFMFATAIFILSKKFNLLHTTLLSWFMVFVMLWVVLWNVNVLPVDMLWIVVPFSLFETFIAAFICKRLASA